MGKEEKLFSYGLEVSDESKFVKIDDLALDAIRREQQRINYLKREEMVRLTYRLKQLGYNLLQTAKKTNENRYVISDLLKYLEEMINKFAIFYEYGELLKEEKQAKLDLENIDKVIAQNDSDDLNRQISKLQNTDILTKRNLAIAKLDDVTKRLKIHRQKLNAQVEKYDFADYIQFLDDEVDAFKKKFESLHLSKKMAYVLENWYQLMDQEIAGQVMVIGSRMTIYEDYLLKYGLVDKRHSGEERAVNLLQLFNPQMKIHYDMLDGSIYLPNEDNLKLPVNFSYSLLHHTMTVQMDNKIVSFKVRQNYTPQTFLGEIEKLNPQVSFNLAGEEGILYATKNISELKLPSGFCIEKQKETGELIITNRYIMAENALTFKFKRKMLVEELNKMYDLSNLKYEPKVSQKRNNPSISQPKAMETAIMPQKETSSLSKAKPLEFAKEPINVEPRHYENRRKVVSKKPVQNKKNRDYRKLLGYLKIASTFVGSAALTVINSCLIKPIALLASKGTVGLKNISEKGLDNSLSKIHQIQKANHEKAKQIREQEKRKNKHEVGVPLKKEDIPFESVPHTFDDEFDLDAIIAEVNGYDLGHGRR